MLNYNFNNFQLKLLFNTNFLCLFLQVSDDDSAKNYGKVILLRQKRYIL